MNQNDMDRYYWRTGQRWSGDLGPRWPRIPLAGRIVAVLALAFAVTQIALLLMR